MNKAFLIGRLVADPEMRRTGNGCAVCQFRLAVRRKCPAAGGAQEADFLPVIAWGKLGETCARYLNKGRKCAVIGEIRTRSYDAQDGSRRHVTEIVADEVEFLGGRVAAVGEQAVGEDDDLLPFADDQR